MEIENKLIYIVMAIFLVAITILAAEPHGIWPDGALYLKTGMNMIQGKGLTIPGESGMVSPLMPFLTGVTILLLNGNRIAFYIPTILFALISIFFTYKVANKFVSKFYSLLASITLAGNYLVVFYSTKALLEIYDLGIGVMTLYLLLDYLENKTIKKSAYLGLSLAAAYLIRITNVLYLLPIVIFSIFYYGKGSIKDRVNKIDIPVIAIPIITAALFIVFIQKSLFGVYQGVATGNLSGVISDNLPSMLGVILSSAHLLVFIGALVGLYSMKKYNMIFIMWLILAPFSKIKGVPYDVRYVVPILSVVSISFGIFLESFEKQIKEIDIPFTKYITAVVVVIIAYSGFTQGVNLFNAKKGGYLEIENSSLWIKDHTNSTETIMSGAVRITSLFSDRLVLGFPSTDEELFDKLSEYDIRYIEVNNYDWAQPKYAFDLVNKYPDKFKIITSYMHPETKGGSYVLEYMRDNK